MSPFEATRTESPQKEKQRRLPLCSGESGLPSQVAQSEARCRAPLQEADRRDGSETALCLLPPGEGTRRAGCPRTASAGCPDSTYRGTLDRTFTSEKAADKNEASGQR